MKLPETPAWAARVSKLDLGKRHACPQGEVGRQSGRPRRKKSDASELPRPSQEEGSAGRAGRTRGAAARSSAPVARTEGRTGGRASRRGGLTFGVGADEDPHTAARGHEVRRQGREVPAECRPAERGVPGAGQLGARAGRPHRPLRTAAAASCSSGSCPRLRGSAGSIPAGGAAQSQCEPRALAASSVVHALGRRGAAIGTLGPGSPPPAVPLGVCFCSLSRVQCNSRRRLEVSVAAATRVAPIRAGRRPRRPPSPRPPPHPRPLREAGAARRRARSGRGSNFVCAKASGSGLNAPTARRTNDRGLNGAGASVRGASGRTSRECGRLPSWARTRPQSARHPRGHPSHSPKGQTP